MRVGSIVYATEQGIGRIARDFYRHGIITDALIVDRPRTHVTHEFHPEWFPRAQVVPLNQTALATAGAEFLSKLDVALFIETPFEWSYISYCREHGVKTALMTMYECTPDPLPALPDLFLCPSELDLSCFVGPKYGKPAVHLPTPVPDWVQWRQRDGAHVFVHNAGHGGLRGRNGTAQLLEAWPHVRSPAKLLVRTQNMADRHLWDGVTSAYGIAAHLYRGTLPQEELYREGDVFVFPEKFSGQSCPLEEARAAGMLVMATDRFPHNKWLPGKEHNFYNHDCPYGDDPSLRCTCPSPLIPPEGYIQARIGPAYREFTEAVVSPKQIAATIDAWYGADIRDYSRDGKEWAEGRSWAALGPKYKKVLEELLS